MKKIILTTIMAICGAFILNMNAQTTTSFGIKLNGNLTNVKLTNHQGKDSFKAGASIGGFSKIEFNKHFALQPELLVNYTEKKVWSDNEKVKFKYASVEIPIYALGQFEAGSGKIFFGIGPHIGYGFSIDSRKEGLDDCVEGANKVELSHWYMGGGVIAGYEFKNGLMINAGYQLGYDLRSKNKTSSMDTQTISLGIGYRF
jgi:hypothetical protein